MSLGYLSEVERGRKEASSELLNAICAALAVPLSEVLANAGAEMACQEEVARIAAVPRAAKVVIPHPASRAVA